MKRHIIASVLFGGSLGCGRTPMPEAVAGPAQTAGGSSFRVHHALSGQELSAWQDVERSISGFLRAWEEVGLRAKVPIEIVIQPEAALSKVEALRRLHGENFLSRLAGIRAEVAATASAAELSAVARRVVCEFPPLLTDAVVLPGDMGNGQFEKLRSKALARLDAVTAPGLPLQWFKPNNAFGGVVPGGNCAVVVLGRSENLEERFHAFLQKDVVHHELGHVLHDGAWGESRRLVTSTLLNEAIADVLAHALTGDSCHNRLPVPNPVTGDVCARRLDVAREPLFDAMWHSPDGHESASPLRALLWRGLREDGLERFKFAFSGAVKAMPRYFRERYLMSTEPPEGDPFLREAERLARDTALAVAFLQEFCDRRGGCEGLEAALGAPLESAIENLEKNAPATIGAQGVERTLPSGEPVRLAFQSAGGDLEAVLTRNGSEVAFEANGFTWEPDARVLVLRFLGRDGRSRLEWTSEGALTLHDD